MLMFTLVWLIWCMFKARDRFISDVLAARAWIFNPSANGRSVFRAESVAANLHLMTSRHPSRIVLAHLMDILIEAPRFGVNVSPVKTEYIQMTKTFGNKHLKMIIHKFIHNRVI